MGLRGEEHLGCGAPERGQFEPPQPGVQICREYRNSQRCNRLGDELKKRAKELGLSGYSGLTKQKLITKLRNH
ncbi:hypothetical protein D8S82_32395 [Mycobacterium hodleri]|uniref:Rho termination factor N-terminal domain-containing protein n=1 Tax=Mycolicibacterium hodleri TaxID=49897 RepID=A0A544VQX6_9MYCO|nr:hypothetical protein D8S82_32395 [Mycolicibacterium hodleri]